MTMKGIKLSLLFSLIGFCAFGQDDEPIPIVAFSQIFVNMNFPQYRALKNEGGFVEIEGGVRGIIVYCESLTNYIAYERDCPYGPRNPCAQVGIDISRLFLTDFCCGSTFNFSDGYPTKGPATRPMRKYKTSLSGSTLTITDEIVY
jgi:hypothetical protein